MTYDYKHSGTEEFIIKQCLSNGVPLPEFIENKPILAPSLGVYYEGFLDLTTCRAIGFGGVGGIPWTAIDQYAKWLNLDEYDSYDFKCIIMSVDAAYLKLVNTKT